VSARRESRRRPGRTPHLVRPYVLTGGRTRGAAGALALETSVCTQDPPPELARHASPESRRIMELASVPIALAELAGRLLLPIGVVRVLVGDLVVTGSVRVLDSSPPDGAPDIHLLRRLLDGIRAL
jgi:Protein of unknown function (DUF742)